MNAFGYARIALFGAAAVLAGGGLTGCAPTVGGSSFRAEDVALEMIATVSAKNDQMPGGVAVVGCFPRDGPVDGLAYRVSYGDGTTSADPSFVVHRYAKEGAYLVTCDAAGAGESGSASVEVTIR